MKPAQRVVALAAARALKLKLNRALVESGSFKTALTGVIHTPGRPTVDTAVGFSFAL